MSALPTAAASATVPTVSTWRLSATPNPTAMGRLVCARTRLTKSGRSLGRSLRAPVTPVTLTQYTNPSASRQPSSMRSSVLVGASMPTSPKPVLPQRGAQFRGLIGGQVGHYESIDAGFRAIGGVRLDAVAEDGVVIAHKHERSFHTPPRAASAPRPGRRGCSRLPAARGNSLPEPSAHRRAGRCTARPTQWRRPLPVRSPARWPASPRSRGSQPSRRARRQRGLPCAHGQALSANAPTSSPPEGQGYRVRERRAMWFRGRSGVGTFLIGSVLFHFVPFRIAYAGRGCEVPAFTGTTGAVRSAQEW